MEVVFDGKDNRKELVLNAKENRKELVKALVLLTQQPPVYVGPPTYAYEVGNYTVNRNGNIVIPGDTDESVVQNLIDELGNMGFTCVMTTQHEDLTTANDQQPAKEDDISETADTVEENAETEETETSEPEEPESEESESEESETEVKEPEPEPAKLTLSFPVTFFAQDAMISILAARAQEESRSASENQKWHIRKSYEKGVPVTGNCLGYRMVDHQFLIEDEEEQIVLKIFSMYLSGMGKSAIAKQLTRDGIKTPGGNDLWSPNTIAFIIRNEKYSGNLLLGKQYKKDYISKKTMQNHGERPMYFVENAHECCPYVSTMHTPEKPENRAFLGDLRMHTPVISIR